MFLAQGSLIRQSTYKMNHQFGQPKTTVIARDVRINSKTIKILNQKLATKEKELLPKTKAFGKGLLAKKRFSVTAVGKK